MEKLFMASTSGKTTPQYISMLMEDSTYSVGLEGTDTPVITNASRELAAKWVETLNSATKGFGIADTAEKLKTAEQEVKQLLELRELELAYISDLEANNERLCKRNSILTGQAALYHDRYIDTALTEHDSDSLENVTLWFSKKEQENTCHHCGKELAEGEGTHYEQGLLCDECPDKEIIVWNATTGEVTLYEKTFTECCALASAWFKNDFAGTILQHAMTVGEYYSLPEYQG